MTGRIGIDDIRPQINGGATPSKAVVGEVVPTFAVIWREGHDAMNATLNVKGPKESAFASRSQRIPMHFSDHDPNQVNATYAPSPQVCAATAIFAPALQPRFPTRPAPFCRRTRCATF